MLQVGNLQRFRRDGIFNFELEVVDASHCSMSKEHVYAIIVSLANQFLSQRLLGTLQLFMFVGEPLPMIRWSSHSLADSCGTRINRFTCWNFQSVWSTVLLKHLWPSRPWKCKLSSWMTSTFLKKLCPTLILVRPKTSEPSDKYIVNVPKSPENFPL